MKPRYHITKEGRGGEPNDAELARYRDGGKLLYNYQQAARMLHKRPLYKDPKAFIALVLIVLLALFISEVVEKEGKEAPQKPAAESPAVD